MARGVTLRGTVYSPGLRGRSCHHEPGTGRHPRGERGDSSHGGKGQKATFGHRCQDAFTSAGDSPSHKSRRNEQGGKVDGG